MPRAHPLRNCFRPSSSRRRERERFRPGLETLEDRVLLTVEPLTLTDPAYFGDTGYFGTSLKWAASRPSISADGQLVVFQSEANNLVPNDFNNTSDIFLYHRGTGQVSLISVDRTGTRSGDGDSIEPQITPDGRYVLFRSHATQLDPTLDTPRDFGGSYHLFLRDLQTGTTRLIDVNTAGTGSGNGNAFDPAITPDGRFIVFASGANNLVDGDTNGRDDIFLWDGQTGDLERISLTDAEGQSDNHSYNPSITPDGRFIVFATWGKLEDIDNNGLEDIYVRDRTAGTTELVTADVTNSFSANSHAGNLSEHPISADGRFVVFWTNASNLVSQNTAFQTNAFVRDLVNNTTYLLSANAAGTAGTNGFAPVITPDGRYVAWVGDSSAIASDVPDTNGRWDVYRSDLSDLEHITTRMVSVNASGTNGGNGNSGVGMYPFNFSAGFPEISPDGRYIAFASEASNLVGAVTDGNSSRDVFVRDMQENVTFSASMAVGGATTANSGSFTPALNDPAQSGGRVVVALESVATNLTSDRDGNGQQDVFVRDVTTGFTELASRRSPLLPVETLSGSGISSIEDVTPDGRYVLFVSSATDLVTDVQTPGFTSFVYLHDRQTGKTEVVSVLPGGTTGGPAGGPAQISDDGRYVFFNSSANYQPGVNANSRGQVYRLDRVTGTYQMVSVSTNPVVGSTSEWSSDVTVSGDGRYVAWTSSAGDLVPGFVDNNGTNFQFNASDVFVRDMVTGITRLVSHVPGNNVSTGNNRSYRPVFSKDGSKIIFVSLATDLVSGKTDTNGQADLFAYDVATQQLQLVSVDVTGTGTGNSLSGDSDYSPPVISDDGRYVAFVSSATNLTSMAVSGQQVFRHDLQTGITDLISINTAGTGGSNNQAHAPFLSADGKKILFESRGTNLTGLPTGNFLSQVYLRDLSGETPTTTLVSLNTAGTAGGDRDAWIGGNFRVGTRLTADGRYASFLSQASDLVPGFVDGNGLNQNGNNGADLYLRDLQRGITVLASYNNSGTASGDVGPTTGQEGHGGGYHLARETPTVIFDGAVTNLVHGDRNWASDIFAYTYRGAGSIAGTLFNDLDSNGVRDAGENGIAYWTVYLDANGNRRFDSGEENVQTDAQGNYRFTGLPAGTWTVALVPGIGFTQTGPAAPHTYSVTLATDTTAVTGKDFAVHQALGDLVVTSAAGPQSAAVGGDVTVSWVVGNAGSAALTGSWQDAVYLSTDGTLDSNDILLGTVTRTGGLGAGASYTATTSVRLPAVLPGTYHLLIQTDRRREVTNEENRTNNLFTLATPTQLTLTSLTPGTPTAGQFSAAGQDRYYQVTVAEGQTLNVVLDSIAATGATELYVRRFTLPTLYEFDFASRSVSPDQRVTVPLTQPGIYYIVAHSTNGAAATAAFTLTATTVGFGLTSVSPNAGGNTGSVTVAITGTRLTPTTQYQLIQGATTLSATAVDFRNATLAYVSFNLTGAATGGYTVRAVDGVQTSDLPGAFTVTAGVSTPVQLTLTVPSDVRLGRTGTVILEYANTGNVDVPAPFLTLSVTNAVVKLAEQREWGGSSIQFLGISHNGPAGVLRPGQRESVRIDFLSTGADETPIDFATAILTDLTQTIDWAALKDVVRPGDIPTDAWDAIYPNLLAEVGTTAGDYLQVLSRDASYLSSLGIYTADILRLLTYQLDRANAVFTAGSRISVTDASFPTPGTDLVFVRQHQQSITGRYTVGPFGRGWTHNWDVEAITLASGDVVIRSGGGRRLFTRQPDGSYRGEVGDYATLTLASGKYTLTEPNTTVWAFRADGKLDFVREDNGNRVTLGYDGAGRLTSLMHAAGQTITLHYNAQGRIDQLIDPAGRMVSYGYDATGEHLTSYTDRYGTHTYTYVTGQGAQREHALESVNFSDDTHVEFSYDSRGRLIRENRDNNSVPVTYAYLPGGGFSSTNATNGTTTYLHDDRGTIERIIDPLGRVIDYAYDSARQLVGIELPQGVEYRYTYDARGNVIGVVNALGHQTTFTYDGHGNLTSFTDARGNTTRYTYDAEDNLLSEIDAAGRSELFGYDARGNVTTSTTRRGRAIGYQYNGNGQLTRKDFADGSFVEYGYDARGRMTTARDANGTITLEYNALDALEKITYPDGKFLRFEYNAVAQRTRSVDQDGFTTNYTYDDLGRPDELTDGLGVRIVKYAYDPAGRVIREDKGNGTATTYEYDVAGQLLHLRHLAPDGTTVNSFFDYTYNALGLRTSMTTGEGTTAYRYDAMGQLTKITLPGGRTIEYVYDAAGNRTQVIDSQLGTTNYVANELNQYLSAGGTSYTYDADGNLLSKTDTTGTTTFAFNDENRLVSVSGPGVTAAYQYNPFGIRDSLTVNGLTTRYLIDPTGLGSVFAEYNGGGLVAHYTSQLFFGLVSRVSAGGAAAYYDFDALANTIGLTDGIGGYVNRYSYLPFGETTVVSAGVANPFTFVGQFGVQRDVAGTFDMRRRNYDLTVGQFLSNDPIGLKGGDVNLRRYVGNNPVLLVDPSGLQGVAGAALGVGGNAAAGNSLGGDLANAYSEGAGSSSGQASAISATAGVVGLAGPAVGPFAGALSLLAATQNIAGQFNGLLSDPAFGGSTKPRSAFDPNDITGPAGFGDDRYLAPGALMPYTIRFENVATDPQGNPTIPAQEVFVTHQLDTELDWTTFTLGDLGFGSLVVDVPDGLRSYSTTLSYQNLDGSPLLVNVVINLDLLTGIVTWTFRSIDPDTGELPDGVFDGFLPPNDASHRGEGFVTYTIRAKEGQPSGTRFEQQAFIVFDTNTPIETNIFTNTLDSGPPTSTVSPLPGVLNSTSFPVSWSGQDDAGGSGIATYDVFVSIDNGPFTPWLTGTTQRMANYTGSFGHSYAFYSVATDNVGFVQATPTQAQASTTLREPPPTPALPMPLPPAPTPVSASVILQGRGARKQLWVQVRWSDGRVQMIRSPFQKPSFRSIVVGLRDQNGDGSFDSLRITARKDSRKLERVVAL